MPSATEELPSTSPLLPPPDLSNRLPKLIPRRRQQQERRPSNPPPPTVPLSPVPQLDGHVFASPSRRILSEHDHALFRSSATYDLIVSFVFTLADSVANTTISTIKSSSAAQAPIIKTLTKILEAAQSFVKQYPPIDTGSRFGNPAFRDFLSAVERAQSSWHQELGVNDEAAAQELSAYLNNAFGSGSRIDYGSGHELNFILWLLCLRQLNLLPDSTFPAVTLVIFPLYLELMRDVQSTYYLEPAGSHGVWGLDDYQFLPFLFGASQLLGHKHIRPLSIHNEMIIEECSKDFLYLDQVRWVNSTKTVQGLRWHSPMLDDISAAKSWVKVEGGMRRMFLAEVLGKLPVAQHFLFGSLLSATADMSPDVEALTVAEDGCEMEVTIDGMKHKHKASSWGDCCGIRVPSAIGANREEMKMGQANGLRRVPFD